MVLMEINCVFIEFWKKIIYLSSHKAGCSFSCVNRLQKVRGSKNEKKKNALEKKKRSMATLQIFLIYSIFFYITCICLKNQEIYKVFEFKESRYTCKWWVLFSILTITFASTCI